MNEQLTVILQRVEELPTLPGISMQVMQMVNNPQTSAFELAKLIEKDAALATKILKTVNSAYYSLSRKIGSIQHAIGFLGFRKLSQLIVSVSVFKDLSVPDSAYSMKKFWIHSLLTAECARLTSSLLHKGREDDAYTAGLLHDIGKLFMVKYFPELMSAVFKKSEDEGICVIDAEKQVIATDHAEVGSLLAQKWHLPEFIIDAIRHHHGSSNEPYADANSDIVHIVAFSDILTHQVTSVSYPVPGTYTYTPDILNKVGLHEEKVIQLTQGIEEKLSAAEEMLHILRE